MRIHDDGNNSLTYWYGSPSTGGYFSNDEGFDTFEIGSRFLSTGRDTYYGGVIDEFRIYNAAIPISQIRENYLAGLNKLLANNGITQTEYNQRIADLNKSVAQD